MEKKIKCPQCARLSIYSQKNKFRPFCSKRCRMIDLGDWAEGNHALASDQPLREEDVDQILHAKNESHPYKH